MNYNSSAIVFSCVTLCLAFTACRSTNRIVDKNGYPEFFTVGHRGARGLAPENTIPSMIAAISNGANTVEVDVHVSKDGQVLVYHDASFDPHYTSMPDGSDIPKDRRKDYIFYQNNYSDIRSFIIGRKEYPEFPQQKRISTYAPLLSELIDSVEAYTRENGLSGIYYLVEVKSGEKTDGIEHPAPAEFMKILMDMLKPKNLGNRLIIQSFDMRPLQVLHREYPDVRLGFLTGNIYLSFEENIRRLGFKPTFYNPNYNLVNAGLVQKCHSENILVEPWTVNSIDDMKKMKALGVDGIITDYPNLFRYL